MKLHFKGIYLMIIYPVGFWKANVIQLSNQFNNSILSIFNHGKL